MHVSLKISTELTGYNILIIYTNTAMHIHIKSKLKDKVDS